MEDVNTGRSRISTPEAEVETTQSDSSYGEDDEEDDTQGIKRERSESGSHREDNIRQRLEEAIDEDADEERNSYKGCKDSQQAELDTFANTAARTTQRIICSCADLFNWKLTALDVSTAFLQGLKYGDQGRVIHLKVDAEITVFLRELPGFEDFDNNTEVTKLLRVHMDLSMRHNLALEEANWKATLLDPALRPRAQHSTDQHPYQTVWHYESPRLDARPTRGWNHYLDTVVAPSHDKLKWARDHADKELQGQDYSKSRTLLGQVQSRPEAGVIAAFLQGIVAKPQGKHLLQAALLLK
eukprot:427704-Amphidinium_carterae.4